MKVSSRTCFQNSSNYFFQSLGVLGFWGFGVLGFWGFGNAVAEIFVDVSEEELYDFMSRESI